MIYQAVFLDMGRAQIVGEVDAIDEKSAQKLARERFRMKRIRPANRIFVREKTESGGPAETFRRAGLSGNGCTFGKL